MTVSSLLDALVLTQFGVLSITQHRQTLASLRQSDGTGNTTKLSWTLKAVKTLLKVQSAMHALDYLTLVALQEGFGAPTLTWSAKLAAALVSLQLDQLVAVKPAFVAAFVAFSSVVALMREIFTQPALTFCIVSAASNAPLLVLLLQHLYTSVRRSDSMVLRNSNTDLLDLAYEKASAAEDGHAVNEKPVVYKGYAILSTDTWKDFKLIDFTPKKMADYDVEVAIKYCGVCASDVHTITGGWHPDIILPMITGHEIVGHVKRVGPKVTQFKPGDRVGVGAQSDSCRDCDRCRSNNEQYCFDAVSTYNARHLTGEVSHGGYATGKVANELFVFPIPEELPLKQAASMCCGGLTVFSPLKRYGAGPGKKVAVIGIGGLGHYALQFAAALGSDEVIAISHTESKKEDALKMGATRFIATANGGLQKSGVKDVDIIISTIDVNTAIPVKDLCAITRVGGALVSVGLPDGQVPLELGALSVSATNLACTNIGSKAEAMEMFDLAVKKGVRTWIQEYDMKDCSTAVQALHGDLPGTEVRYRQVLKMDIEY